MKFIRHLAAIAVFLCLSFTALAAKEEKAALPEHTHEQKPSIIALAPHIVEMLFDVGAGSQIIATTAFADYPEAAKEIPQIGNYVRLQIERIIELQPDLIIAWKSGNPSDDLARLKQLGFTIVYSQPHTFEEIADELRLFGELTGHKAKGKKVALQFEHDLQHIIKKYQEQPLITGFYELWSRPLTTVANGSWPQQLLDVCRVNNPFEPVKAPYPQISIEQVLATEVELIIQPLSINQTEREGFNWQDWSIIPAVANGHIIQPDADAVHRMSVRSLTALDKLCEDIEQVRQKISANKNRDVS